MNIHRRGGAIVVLIVVRLFVQMIIIRDPAHEQTQQQNSGQPPHRSAGPHLLLFYDARGEAHRAPGQAENTAQLGVPGHQVQMSFAADFAPGGDNGDERDEKLKSIGEAQPRRI